MVKFIMVILLLGMTSCAVKELSRNSSENPVVVESAPVEDKSSPVAMPAPKIIIDDSSKKIIINPNDNNLFYKAFLFPEDKLYIELVSFIYLPKKPTTDKEKNLYLQICQSWSDTVLSYEEASVNYEKNIEKLVPFFWPLKTKLNTMKCDKLIENYDYARAQQLLRKHKLDIKKVQFVSLYKDIHVTMDVSSLLSNEDINKAFHAWISYMTKVPEKNDTVYVFTMIESLKKVLGALDYFVTIKFKG